MLLVSLFFVFCFGKTNNYKVNSDIEIIVNDERPVLIESSSNINVPQSREEIDLFTEDFEDGAQGWTTGSGWQFSNAQYNSENTSMRSPNDESTYDNVWNLMSPEILLPALGEGETMGFSFYVYGDTPTTSQTDDPSTPEDESTYLADYYQVSIMDIDALAWGANSFDSYDGNSYWCGVEDQGNFDFGYLDSWIQFLDTPSFTVPASGVLSADMKWAIEDYAGATVAGTCTDGWDAANVRISVDGGESWSLLNGSDPYDFDCGYGWLWNSSDYDDGGPLNDLAPGWGGTEDWHNVTFDLSQYVGQEAIVRFAFGSDPAYCTSDDGSITGFHVDNISVTGGALDCNPESGCDVSIDGAVWVDQFYDYFDTDRPGYLEWQEYVAGLPFNGNVFMDISDFAEKTVTFRFQSRYDEDAPGTLQGEGIFVDDFRIFKNSGGNFPAPFNLTGESQSESVNLTWSDMNASGTDDFAFDNDGFADGITVTGNSAWAGARIDLAGASTVNSVSVFNINATDSTITVGAFPAFGTLFSGDPEYTTTVDAVAGQWTTVDVSGWNLNNSYIIAHEFNGSFSAALDPSASGANSVVKLNAGWDGWSDIATANALSDGAWGVRANITYDGAGVSYNVYVDGLLDQSGLTDNSTSVSGLTNNITYEFAVSATYSEGDESEFSNTIEVTPQAQTVHEESYDDGSQEEWFNAGSGQFTAVKYSALDSGEDVVRFKWYQEGVGGAFYLKMYEDDGGMPGSETYSRVMAGSLVDGWNEFDLSDQGLVVSGDFWIGTKEFSSTKPFGVDTSSNSGNSMATTAGAWGAIDGNLMVRVFLDCGEECSEGPTCTAGDVNSDGSINVQDIVSVVGFVLGTTSPDDDQSCASDLNNDGFINVQDIVGLVNLILG